MITRLSSRGGRPRPSTTAVVVSSSSTLSNRQIMERETKFPPPILFPETLEKYPEIINLIKSNPIHPPAETSNNNLQRAVVLFHPIQHQNNNNNEVKTHDLDALQWELESYLVDVVKRKGTLRGFLGSLFSTTPAQAPPPIPLPIQISQIKQEVVDIDELASASASFTADYGRRGRGCRIKKRSVVAGEAVGLSSSSLAVVAVDTTALIKGKSSAELLKLIKTEKDEPEVFEIYDDAKVDKKKKRQFDVFVNKYSPKKVEPTKLDFINNLLKDYVKEDEEQSKLSKKKSLFSSVIKPLLSSPAPNYMGSGDTETESDGDDPVQTKYQVALRQATATVEIQPAFKRRKIYSDGVPLLETEIETEVETEEEEFNSVSIIVIEESNLNPIINEDDQDNNDQDKQNGILYTQLRRDANFIKQMKHEVVLIEKMLPSIRLILVDPDRWEKLNLLNAGCQNGHDMAELFPTERKPIRDLNVSPFVDSVPPPAPKKRVSEWTQIKEGHKRRKIEIKAEKKRNKRRIKRRMAYDIWHMQQHLQCLQVYNAANLVGLQNRIEKSNRYFVLKGRMNKVVNPAIQKLYGEIESVKKMMREMERVGFEFDQKEEATQHLVALKQSATKWMKDRNEMLPELERLEKELYPVFEVL